MTTENFMTDSDLNGTNGFSAFFNVQTILSALKQFRRIALYVWLAVIFLSLILLNLVQPVYTATTVISPPIDLDQSASGTSSLGGARGLLGIGPNMDQPKMEKLINLMTSRRLAEQLITKTDILPNLFPADYDPATKSWVEPKSFLFSIKKSIKGLLRLSQWQPPNAFSLANFLSKHIDISQSPRSTLKTISFSAKSPELASTILQNVVTEADAIVREDAKERALAATSYINRALQESVTNTEERQSLTALLLSTNRSLLLASTTRTFSMEVIDPPSASPTPISPNTQHWLIVSILLATIAAIGAAMTFKFHPLFQKQNQGRAWFGNNNQIL